MGLSLREQEIIKEWNKKGLAGLRVSSLDLLANIGGGTREGAFGVLVRHTIRNMPFGLWEDAEKYSREICFIAGVNFDYEAFRVITVAEEGERVDEEFDD